MPEDSYTRIVESMFGPLLRNGCPTEPVLQEIACFARRLSFQERNAPWLSQELPEAPERSPLMVRPDASRPYR